MSCQGDTPEVARLISRSSSGTDRRFSSRLIETLNSPRMEGGRSWLSRGLSSHSPVVSRRALSRTRRIRSGSTKSPLWSRPSSKVPLLRSETRKPPLKPPRQRERTTARTPHNPPGSRRNVMERAWPLRRIPDRTRREVGPARSLPPHTRTSISRTPSPEEALIARPLPTPSCHALLSH